VIDVVVSLVDEPNVGQEERRREEREPSDVDVEEDETFVARIDVMEHVIMGEETDRVDHGRCCCCCCVVG
jgi:hypothetical protein